MRKFIEERIHWITMRINSRNIGKCLVYLEGSVTSRYQYCHLHIQECLARIYSSVLEWILSGNPIFLLRFCYFFALLLCHSISCNWGARTAERGGGVLAELIKSIPSCERWKWRHFSLQRQFMLYLEMDAAISPLQFLYWDSCSYRHRSSCFLFKIMGQ